MKIKDCEINGWRYEYKNTAKELSLEEMDYIGERFDYKKNFYGKAVVEISGLMRVLLHCEMFLVYHGDVFVGFIYMSKMPKSDECEFHFAVLDKNEANTGGWNEIIGKILQLALDKKKGLGYTAIHGFNPYRSLVRFSKLFGFEHVGTKKNGSWNGYEERFKDEYHLVLNSITT